MRLNFIFRSCSCPDGWFGVMCRGESTVCTTGKHACAEGSECAVHPNGTYFCLCPFGRRGTLCEEGSSIQGDRTDRQYPPVEFDL